MSQYRASLRGGSRVKPLFPIPQSVHRYYTKEKLLGDWGMGFSGLTVPSPCSLLILHHSPCSFLAFFHAPFQFATRNILRGQKQQKHSKGLTSKWPMLLPPLVNFFLSQMARGQEVMRRDLLRYTKRAPMTENYMNLFMSIGQEHAWS